MEQVATVLAIVVFLAAVAEALTEFFIAPLWKRYKLDGFWLVYIGAGVAFGLVMASGQSLLAGYLPENLAILGRILTGLLAGRGSNWVHDFFSNQRKRAELAKQQLNGYHYWYTNGTE